MLIDRKRWNHGVAVLCIALGTAAVSAVLTLFDASLLRPLPFPEADRLVRVWMAEPQGDQRIDLSLPEMTELKQALTGVESFAGVARSRLVARLPAGTERLRGEAVDADYFPLIGMRPALGRLFAPDDFGAGGEPTILLSHAFWSSRYRADPSAIGQVLAAGDQQLRIIGVLPAGFDGTIENDVIEVWLPQAHYRPVALRDDRRVRLGWTLARLAPGTTLEALQAQLDSVHQGWRADFPEQYAANGLRTEPFGENWRAPLRANAPLLLAAVLVLLAIAVANVAALLLARALDRRRELALRSALGARRSRIARELLFETARLALLGGAIGALAAPWLLQALLAISPLSLPGYIDLSLSLPGSLLVAATLVIAALGAALLPAWQGSRVAPQEALAGEGRGGGGRNDRRLWTLLMGGELALSFVLLVLGALLVRSYLGLATVDTGFRRDDMLRMAVTLAPEDYGAMEDLAAIYPRLRDALAAEPAVRSVGLVSPTLPPWDGHRPEVRHAALQLTPDQPGLRVGAHRVDPGLLSALDIPLLAGRGIEQRDTADTTPVAVISAALAARFGGVERALGSEVEVVGDRPGRAAGRFRVVGIAGDVAWDGLAEQDTGRYIRYGANDDAGGTRHDVYLALAQQPSPVVSIAVHTALPPEQLIEPLRRALAGIAPASAVHWVSTMEEELAGEYAASRFYLTLLVAFGLSALLLAAVGLFALLSHSLLRRQHEIGIRMALGAATTHVARMVLANVARLLCVALVLGAVLAQLASRFVQSALYGVTALDPLAYLAAAAVLAVVAIAASAWPLLRAVRVPPSLSLRSE